MPAGMSQPERVKEAWDRLVGAARAGEVLTYGQLAAQLGRPGYRPIAQYMPSLLTPILHHCDERGLPRLNDLVVGQRSRRPNYAPPGYDHEASQRRVFAFDWDAVTVDAGDFAGQ